MAFPALAWATPPQLRRSIHEALRDQLVEAHASLDARGRRSLALWLRHLIALRFITVDEVAAAMSHVQPFGALNRLYATSCARLAEHLNGVAERHSRGFGKTFRGALEVALSLSVEGEDPALMLGMNGYLEIPVDSLHRVPAPLAAMTCESLTLVSRCFVEFLSPGDMWDGQGMGWNESFREEYEALRKVRDQHGIEAVASTVKDSDYCHFYGDHAQLSQQFEYARQMFEERPTWMTPTYTKTPITHARTLRRRVAQYMRTHGSHPWGEYVDHVCATIAASFRDDRAWRQRQQRAEATLLERWDTDVPMFFGLWVTSGSGCECDNAQQLYDSMGQAGEEPVDRYSLTRLASAQLRQTLDGTAIGIGLLLRAGAVNTTVQRTAS